MNLCSSLIVHLELKTYQHLKASRRPRADRMSKKRRAQIAHRPAEVNVIENVERIHCYGRARARILLFLTFSSFGGGQPNCLSKSKVERRGPWSFQTFSHHPCGPCISKLGHVIR